MTARVLWLSMGAVGLHTNTAWVKNNLKKKKKKHNKEDLKTATASIYICFLLVNQVQEGVQKLPDKNKIQPQLLYKIWTLCKLSIKTKCNLITFYSQHNTESKCILCSFHLSSSPTHCLISSKVSRKKTPTHRYIRE